MKIVCTSVVQHKSVVHPSICHGEGPRIVKQIYVHNCPESLMNIYHNEYVSLGFSNNFHKFVEHYVGWTVIYNAGESVAYAPLWICPRYITFLVEWRGMLAIVFVLCFIVYTYVIITLRNGDKHHKIHSIGICTPSSYPDALTRLHGQGHALTG